MAKPKPPHPILQTPRLRLRQFRPDDAAAMHLCFTSPDVMRFWNQPLFTRLIESERQVRNYTECTPAYYRYWAIADATTDKCLGLASYHDGHIRSKRASIGYMIHPAHHRKGLATEAVSALLDHCFGELRLHRLEAFIHPDNTASRALVEKRGFQPEGLLRDHARVGETWRDQLIYARLTPHLDTQP